MSETIGNPDQSKIIFRNDDGNGVVELLTAIQMPSGCMVRSTISVGTQEDSKLDHDVCFIPNVKIVEDVNGGHKLVPLFEAPKKEDSK